MKVKPRKHELLAIGALVVIASIAATGQLMADPLAGGADPNLQNRIEQTVPSATDRLLNNMRESPPTIAPARKPRIHPSHRRHGDKSNLPR